MNIRKIQESDWCEILKIQDEAYSAIQPESEAVLHSKGTSSPNTCLVVENPLGKTIAYCLAHPFAISEVPKLNTIIPYLPKSSNLFIHDLAVSSSAKGQGVATSLFIALKRIADHENYYSFSLVSVQDSKTFWSKMGFQKALSVNVTQTYGEDSNFMISFL
jgi:predicted N-acetyltransferase YhbS